MPLIGSLVLMIGLTVAANLLMKLGASKTPSSLLLGILSWTTFLGLMSFGLAGLAYSYVLKSLPLNVAQSFAAAQFVAVILASYIILAESISPGRWFGIGLIAFGIAVVALTSDNPEAGVPAAQIERQ